MTCIMEIAVFWEIEKMNPFNTEKYQKEPNKKAILWTSKQNSVPSTKYFLSRLPEVHKEKLLLLQPAFECCSLYLQTANLPTVCSA